MRQPGYSSIFLTTTISDHLNPTRANMLPNQKYSRVFCVDESIDSHITDAVLAKIHSVDVATPPITTSGFFDFFMPHSQEPAAVPAAVPTAVPQRDRYDTKNPTGPISRTPMSANFRKIVPETKPEKDARQIAEKAKVNKDRDDDNLAGFRNQKKLANEKAIAAEKARRIARDFQTDDSKSKGGGLSVQQKKERQARNSKTSQYNRNVR
jgi:pyruvate/2-oxoglutarate dehydrogenase complex dihydrolipoamide acyltransferase (E2) component